MSRPFIPAENCVRVELIYTCGSLVAENVFYWQSDHPLNATEIGQLAAAVKASWGTTLKLNMTTNWALTTIKITGMTTDHEPTLSYTAGLPILGSVNTAAPPPNVTFCISCRTGLAGRSNRGRWYIVGIPGTQTPASGVLSAAYAETLRAGVANFQYDLTWGSNPVDGEHVICSFRNNKAWRDAASVHVVTGYTVTDLNLDSMRRRLPGRGRT